MFDNTPLLVILEAPGKTATVSKILRSLGARPRIVATGGHLAGWPSGLFPIGLRPVPGRLDEPRRRLLPQAGAVAARLRNALAAIPDAPVLIAADNDVEGDVIALDAARMVLDAQPAAASRLYRVLPGALTAPAWRAALAASFALGPVPLSGTRDSLEGRAVEGRFRAAVDRWIGALLTRRTALPCGRVRAGLLGMVEQWRTDPGAGAGLPETGELLFACRIAGRPGRTAHARMPLHGPPPESLLQLAERYAGRPVPGFVEPLRPAGAAIAPRYGTAPPYHTADLLVHAGRQHGLPVRRCMQLMQSAYMAGNISYPRTEGRAIDDSLRPAVLDLARAAGFSDGAAEALQATERRASSLSSHVHPARDSHPPLLPVGRADIVARGLPGPVDFGRTSTAEAALTAIVARRAVEACLPSGALPARWHPDAVPDVDRAAFDLLQDLDWEIDNGPRPPWGRMLTTGARAWPLDTILVEGLAREELGRPSTYADHVARAIDDGLVHQPDPFAIPRLTPEAARAHARISDSFRRPDLARLVARIMETPAEPPGLPIAEAMRIRLELLFELLPDELRHRMGKLLSEELPPVSPGPPPVLEAPNQPQREPDNGSCTPQTADPPMEETPPVKAPVDRRTAFDDRGPPETISDRPQEALDTLPASRLQDILEENEADDLRNGSDRAQPDDAVDLVGDGGIAVGVDPDEREIEPEP